MISLKEAITNSKLDQFIKERSEETGDQTGFDANLVQALREIAEEKDRGQQR